MRHLRLPTLSLLFALFLTLPALAQTNTTVNWINASNKPVQTSAANPLPISGSFSAGTFAPGGAYATLTATGSSADAALPAGAAVIVFNTGTTAVSCSLSIGAGTAVASQNIVQASSWIGFTVGSNTHVACIDQTGSASNVVVISGGSGSPTGAGGGSGGGGAVTIADGADVALGAVADAAWVSGNGTAIALLKNIAGGVAGSVPAGSALIGKVGVDQTTPGTTNGVALVGVNAATALAGNGVTGTGSARVTIASDNTAFGVKPTDGTNTITVKAASTPPAVADTAEVTVLRPATPMTPIVAAASDNHAVTKNGAGVAFSVHASNNSATKNYARLYDAGTGFNGCNSATGVIFAFEIPPNDSGFSIALGGSRGIAFTNGLSYCITSGFGLTDTTNATASAILFNISYN